MSRRSKRKDEAREAAAKRRQDRINQTKAAEPILAGKTGQLNLVDTADARMVSRAIRKGWVMPDDLFVDAPKKLHDAINRPGCSTRALVQLSKAIVNMHGQNLEISRVEKPTELAANPTVNVQVVNAVQVIESDDWYGTKAANRSAAAAIGQPAAGNGAPDTDSDFAGSIQSNCLRPAVGQNGVGANGHSQGPRGLSGAT